MGTRITSENPRVHYVDLTPLSLTLLLLLIVLLVSVTATSVLAMVEL